MRLWWSPVKRERNVDFPEPVMEGFSWVWWGSAVVGGTMEDHHGGCSSKYENNPLLLGCKQDVYVVNLLVLDLDPVP